MGRPLSMQRIRASRFTRAMALFAWAMLVLLSLPLNAVAEPDAGGAMPAAMAAMNGHGMPAAAMAGHHHDGCCGSPSSHSSCQCDAMCGSLLLPSAMRLRGPGLLPARYAMFRGVSAPNIASIPPLRPPAV
ncbi:hypothetical protein [Dyella acidiphila]|uniref:CopL family metal-binding regulatory protein n=1 Tax=Dyella acidiphila TaxID=2775866 RepID=A0ABR9GA22_9GAMM|nr:hypothetical protein [Dyella acidiphila]MBE1160854.1 hypothetical protein [Dyella acidiphila]